MLSPLWARAEGFLDAPIPQLMDLKLTVDGLEKERDFYFSKLRDIELICQEHENENSPIITGIVSVLYATEVRAGHHYPPLSPGSPVPHPALWVSLGPDPMAAPGLICRVTGAGGFGICWSPCTMPGGGGGAEAGAGCEQEHLHNTTPGLMAPRAPLPGGLCPTRG